MSEFDTSWSEATHNEPSFEFIEKHPLVAGEQVLISTEQPLYPAWLTEQVMGLRYNTVGIIAVGASYDMAILDLGEDRTSKSRYIVADESISLAEDSGYTRHDTGYIELPDWKIVSVGTAQPNADKLAFNQYVSRHQFNLQATNEGILLVNADPTNATYVTAHVQYKDQVESSGIFITPPPQIANITQSANEFVRLLRAHRYQEADDAAPHGYMDGHPVIGRNTRSVRDSVTFTRNSEILLVDDDSDVLKNLRGKFISFIDLKYRGDTIADYKTFLKDVMQTSKTALRYNFEATEEYCGPHYDHEGITKLSEFVQKGFGVCRQQTALAALLTEDLIDRGVLRGEVRFKRDFLLNTGAHAYMEFWSGRNLTVVDVTNNFVGSWEQAQAFGLEPYCNRTKPTS